MKKKLNKSLLRIKKNNPEFDRENQDIKKMSAYEIRVFRSLQEKYNLSLFSDNLDTPKNYDSNEINQSVKKTLDRIKNDLPFTFKKN
tara:strand:- start:5595 stop:5855 length:261 start_codon:yes stop_codon:yes gene_type:complete